MEDGSEAEEALHCIGVADSIRKLTARMTILTKLVPMWQKQHPYQPANEKGPVITAVMMVPFLYSLIWRTCNRIWRCYDRTGQDRCVHACMHECVHVCMFLHVDVHACVCVHERCECKMKMKCVCCVSAVCVCLCVCMCVRAVRLCVCFSLYVCVNVWVHKCVCVCVCMSVCTRIL